MVPANRCNAEVNLRRGQLAGGVDLNVRQWCGNG